MSVPVVLRPDTSVLHDRRDAGRALRVTWHQADDLYVLSTWRGPVCASTFQLTRSDVPELIAVLARGLADSPPEWSTTRYEEVPHDRGAARLAKIVRHRVMRLLPRHD